MGSDSDQAEDTAEVVTTAREEWKAATTALQRIQQVIKQTTTHKTAADLAEEALVSEPTARKHLETLVEIGTADTIEESGATRYARHEDRLLSRRIRELATEQSRDELIEHIHQMKDKLERFRTEYDAASPEELATTLQADTPAEAWTAVSEWQTTERNLHITQAAINYGRARDLGAVSQPDD